MISTPFITAAYLAKLKKTGSVKNAYVIGGKSVISDDMMNKAATAVGVKKAKRVAGDNRYLTSIEVNKKFSSILTSKILCVSTGKDFPDALSGGVYAAKNKSVLILAAGDLNEGQKKYLESSKNISKIHIFGGKVAVPNDLAEKIAMAGLKI